MSSSNPISPKNTKPLNILISGRYGFIGNALAQYFTQQGHNVSALLRKPIDQIPSNSDVHWQPDTQQIQTHRLENFQCVIHLAGEPVASGRWSPAKKQRILNSRILGTSTLAKALASLQHKPHTFLSASALGIYGHRADELLDETAPPGQGFLPNVGTQWEQATQPATQAGIRTVHMRISIILGKQGGALKRMLTPFKLCLGGRLGPGTQYMSFLSIHDLVRAADHCLNTTTIQGPVNFATPNPVTNLQFTKTLGKLLHRPTIFPVPSFLLKLLFGEMAQDIFLASAKLDPHVLLNTGFEFQHPTLEQAIQAALD